MFVIKAKPIFNSFNINNKTLNLGTFAKIEDAIEARKSAEVKYFGEFRFDMSNKDIINEANLEDHLIYKNAVNCKFESKNYNLNFILQVTHMKKNKTLLSYILGACTIVIFLPIVEEIVNVILSWIEYLKILPGKLVIKGNAELQELQSDFEVESTDTCAIGFHYEPETEEYYDEEE